MLFEKYPPLGVLILFIGWVFVTIVAWLGATAFYGLDEPSNRMIIWASVYALIVTIIGRWADLNGTFRFIYSGAAAILPAVLIADVGWPMLEDGLSSSEHSVKQETESE